jgi:S1-C subfamily serine protease
MLGRTRRAIFISLWLGISGFVPARATAQTDFRVSGSAFVVDSAGLLLTCFHVVEGATKVEILIGDKIVEAAVLSTDKKNDLAVLQVVRKDLLALPLANSNAVEVGEELRAFGFPLASVLGSTIKVTRGTLSGVEIRNAAKVFQIDAAVNPGNSGGPVVNEKGEVVGVINAKLVSRDVSNVGFAVPINYAKKLLELEGAKFKPRLNEEPALSGPALVRRVTPSVFLVIATNKVKYQYLDGVSPDTSKTDEARIGDVAPDSRLEKGGIILGIGAKDTTSFRQVDSWSDVKTIVEDLNSDVVRVRWRSIKGDVVAVNIDIKYR